MTAGFFVPFRPWCPPHGAATVPSMTMGTRLDPWTLTTPAGDATYQAFIEGDELICELEGATLAYHARSIYDLHEWLVEQDDWVPLGAADEHTGAPEGSVEEFGRSDANPVGGWFGLRVGQRGQFGVYLPPVLERLGLAELEHGEHAARVRAI